jgi:Zn-dependent protease
VRILGAPLYVHWSVFAVVLLLALVSLRSPIYAAISIASYLAVIVIHETGHAWVARRLGYHVGAIRIGFVHGECEIDAPQSEFDHVLFAWGGVLAQLAVAVPILIAARLSGEPDFGYAGPVVAFLGPINLMIALVNLAPAPGLDGHIAWRAVPLLWQWQRARTTTKRSLRALKRRR